MVNTETTFLELDISMSDHSFHTKLYDKRDAFGFHICRLPYRDSNMPNRMFYSSACAEVLRICRATSSQHNASLSAKSLIDRMLKQGATEYSLRIALSKSLSKHQTLITKFGTSTEDFINELM